MAKFVGQIERRATPGEKQIFKYSEIIGLIGRTATPGFVLEGNCEVFI